jgi:hypothetical protein
MNKKLTALLGIALLAVAAPSLAVKYGELDGEAHPYVGLMVAKNAQGQPLWRCSGTLISPTYFLTAGHCTEAPAATVEIWFDADVESGIPGNGYPRTGQFSGTPVTHPQFNPNSFARYDLGLVILSAPVPTTTISTYGVLPRLGVLDELAKRRGLQNVKFTAVGYGLQYINPVFVVAERVRMYSTPTLLQINSPGFTGDFSILLSNNHSTGGTCFGDSGGPNFIGNTNVIAGVTSFGINGNCAGTGGVYRVDTADDLDWLAGFGLTPPQ